MLFRRRQPESGSERLRVWLWPRVSWRRSVHYYVKRVLRLSGTPHAIALGVAVGVAVSFTPLLGFHFVVAAALAWLLGGNIFASALGTLFGNPITFPFMWAATYEVGHFLLHGVNRQPPGQLEQALLHRPFGEILPLIEPMLVGSAPLGVAAGAIFYVIVHKAVTTHQLQRRMRLSERNRGVGGGLSRAGQRP
jgi:uncharacterized protein (DUF2062 family)